MSDQRASESRCPRCGGEFEPGFLLDRFLGSKGQELLWAEAALASTSLSSSDALTGHPREGLVPVDAWRCVGCGFLELYAGVGE